MMPEAPRPQATLRRYMVAQGSYFAAAGLASVIYPWLLTHDLHEEEALVGLAQALGAVPTMLLVLAGGAAADGRDLRQYVAQLQLVAALAPIALGMAVAAHVLSLPIAIAYGVLWGTIAAFVMPARDALLFYVAPTDLGLSRTIALATSATFAGQLIGILIGGLASTTGVVALLSVQSALLAIAAIATARLRLAREHETTTRGRPQLRLIWPQIKQGVAIVWAHERLRTVILLIVLGSPVFNGVFLVGFPLLNRTYYGNGSATLAGMPLMFMIGVTISSLTLSRLKPIARQGRAFMFAYTNNFVVFTAMQFNLPYPVLLAVILWWGLGAGIGATMSRSLVQAATPEAARSRVLSIFQFGQVWGGPLGAIVIGFCAQSFGILNALLVPLVVAGSLWIGFRFFTRLWTYEREEALSG
jgi:MFS family permease